MTKSAERMARIANARSLREKRMLAPLPLNEIEKITAILADDPEFAALPEDGKNALRLALYNIRIQLQAHYHDLILAEKEVRRHASRCVEACAGRS